MQKIFKGGKTVPGNGSPPRVRKIQNCGFVTKQMFIQRVENDNDSWIKIHILVHLRVPENVTSQTRVTIETVHLRVWKKIMNSARVMEHSVPPRVRKILLNVFLYLSRGSPPRVRRKFCKFTERQNRTGSPPRVREIACELPYDLTVVFHLRVCGKYLTKLNQLIQNRFTPRVRRNPPEPVIEQPKQFTSACAERISDSIA